MVGSNGWFFVFAQFFRRATEEKTHMPTKYTLKQDTPALTFTKISTADACSFFREIEEQE
jgi:hypothetical protein